MRISDWSSDVCSSDLLEAFAMSRVVAAAFFLAATFVALRSYIEFDLRRFGLRYLRSAGVAVLAAIPAAVFRFTEHDSMNLLELLAVIAACGLDRKSTRLNSRH